MQDKDLYSDLPMKYIPLRDIMSSDFLQEGRITWLYELLRDICIKFLRNDKKLNYNFLPNANTIEIDMKSQSQKSVFEFAKLHWLIHDFRTNGVSFPPQGTVKRSKDNHEQFFLEIHPGTFRWYAIFYNKMLDEHLVVADIYNFFPEYTTLTYEQYNQICNEGFIRDRKGAYQEIETMQSGEKMFVTHERGNHHDWLILKNLEELKKVYSSFTIYTDNDDCLNRLDLLSSQGLEIKLIDKHKWCIPNNENFEGVSVYIPYQKNIEDIFTLDMILELDIDVDVVYFKDTGVTIFNNGSAGCKRLIPQIIDESKPIYLNDFLWARRVEIK